MLAVISLGIMAVTLNWFDVAPAFPLIGAEFNVGIGSLSFLISLYIVGYGLMHIPGGMLGTAIGIKRTLSLGLLVQGLAGIMSGLSQSYLELAIFRVISGVGGSVFVVVGTAAVVAWFREHDVTLALGITGGAASAGGLLSGLIALAGIPGSLLGGYYADRSRNLRVFVIVPLLVVAALLALIPVAPGDTLWALGIGIGFFLIFGFAAWLAVPARVCEIDGQYIATASGLMLTLAAVGGFFTPIIFGQLVTHTSFDTGWIALAVLSCSFALVGFAGRNAAITYSRAPSGAGCTEHAETDRGEAAQAFRAYSRSSYSRSEQTGLHRSRRERPSSEKVPSSPCSPSGEAAGL